MAALTLIVGDAQAQYVEHPTESARRALCGAADLETGEWPDLLRRFASVLPRRGARRLTDAEREREDSRAAAKAEGLLWRETPRERRESLLLDALGDERLILRELTSRLNAELGYPPERIAEERARAVYESHVRSLVTRMHRDGQLNRDAETFNGTHVRYRYSR